MKSLGKLKLAGLVVGGSLLLAACVTPTPYQAAIGEFGQGYSETRIETGKYRVSFKGNTATSRETAENYILLRAAELAKAEGYDYFVVFDETDDSRSVFNSNSTGFNTFGGRAFFGGGFGVGGINNQTTRTRERRTPNISVLIQGFKGEKSDENFMAFSADEVLQNLGGGSGL